MATKSNIDKLMELKQLYEQGILTKEEMEVEKQKILGTYKKVEEQALEQIIVQENVENKEYVNDRIVSNGEENSFIVKHERAIIIVSILVAIIACFFLVTKVILPKPGQQSDQQRKPDEVTTVSLPEYSKLNLKGSIDGKFGLTMHLQDDGRSIEGYGHYDTQEPEKRVTIKGERNQNGTITLHEYDGQTETGLFVGPLISSSDFYGTFTNSKGTVPFEAIVLESDKLEKYETKMEELRREGIAVLTNSSTSIYYLRGGRGNYGHYLYHLNIETLEESKQNAIKCYGDDIENYDDSELIYIKDYAVNYGKITFVIIDGTRHGSGAVLCNTQVWTYNTSNNTWTNLLPSEDGCSGAKFISGKTAIRITLGEVTNYETAYGSADYEYEFRDIDIPLK